MRTKVELQKRRSILSPPGSITKTWVFRKGGYQGECKIIGKKTGLEPGLVADQVGRIFWISEVRRYVMLSRLR